MDELVTPQLVLRRWRQADRESFAALNADPVAMEHMPAVLDRAQSDALVDRIEKHFEEHGFGLWVVDVVQGDERGFAGCVGLLRVAFDAPFAPAVEVGWRLLPSTWGRGYATEAAREACRFGFEGLGLEEIVSFTVPANVRSRAVMERLGMVHDVEGGFEHPRIPEGHRLRAHVLYRLSRERWNGLQSSTG